MSEALKPLIGAAADRPLTRAEAETAFTLLFEGEATPSQMGGLLMAMRTRGETVDEYAAAAAVMQVSESRATDKQMLVEEAGSRIFLLLLLVCQQYMTEDTVVRIAGPDGTLWPTVTSHDLQGEFKIRVETGSMNGESRALRRSEGVQLLTQVTPALAQLGYDTDGVVRSALKRMGYDPDELGVMKMQPQMPAGPAPADPGMLSNGSMMEMLSGLPGPAAMQEGGGI